MRLPGDLLKTHPYKGFQRLAHKVYYPLTSNPSVESPWTQWTLSMVIVRLEFWNEVPWTMSTESMYNVHSVHGQCSLCPWTMSTETMDSVHSVPELFPCVFPTLCLVQNYSNPTKLNAYTQFTMYVVYIS